MGPVNGSHGSPKRTARQRRHLACGAIGLSVALAVFLVWYPVIAALVTVFGMLSSTSIVLLLVTGWLALWVGLEVALYRISEE